MSFPESMRVPGIVACRISQPQAVESGPEISISVVRDKRAEYVAFDYWCFRPCSRIYPIPSVERKAVDNAPQ
jgi:hypothetical protein